MVRKFNSFIWTLVISLLIFAFGFFVGRNRKPIDDKIIIRDTIVDTLLYPSPVPVVVKVVDSIPIVMNTDVSFKKGDSLYVPKIQKIYINESYKAWVSGYQPNLDSIQVYQKIIRQTKRWGIAPMVGIGVGREGFTPFIGVGVYYNINFKK